ncbi:MAG: helix-turn-helix domain-containing protein [Treponema sp.]|jgi:excisionase family DNA binding protein|nr:helix-turn-helix domain-containing protein [Treponema sp.]
MVSRKGRKVKIFSALEVANLCGVVNQTAINWIKNGYLKAFTTPGGQYRIYAKDLAAFLDKRGMSDSGEALQVLMEKAKWSVFLIAAADERMSDAIKDELLKLLPGYEIIQAIDGFETGRLLIEEKPGFLLLDGTLPGVDSYRLIRTVKEDPVFGKPFVFVMETEEDTIRAPDNSDGVFTKPPDINKLAETIKNLEKLINAAIIA